MYYFLYCNGGIHKIGVKNRQLIFLNHKQEEIETEAALGILDDGQFQCKCAEIYTLWQKGQIKKLPKFLQKMLKEELK
ncbi:MAG: hypothetical protein PWR08_1709 [Thermoanaerobacterium sp.]|nr:hypothetical protein [Thermoanaerobacterium sp.]